MVTAMKNRSLLTAERRGLESSFRLGFYQDGSDAMFRPAPGAHVVLTGAPGTGKTRILSALTESACKEMDIYVGDPWLHAGVGGIRPSLATGSAGTLPALADLLERLRDIALERVNGPRPVGDLPAHRPILLVIDEVWSFFLDDGYVSTVDREAMERASDALGLISVHAAAAGITIVLSSQKPCLELLPRDAEQVFLLDLGRHFQAWGGNGEQQYIADCGRSGSHTLRRQQGLYQQPGDIPEVVNIRAL